MEQNMKAGIFIRGYGSGEDHIRIITRVLEDSRGTIPEVKHPQP